MQDLDCRYSKHGTPAPPTPPSPDRAERTSPGWMLDVNAGAACPSSGGEGQWRLAILKGNLTGGEVRKRSVALVERSVLSIQGNPFWRQAEGLTVSRPLKRKCGSQQETGHLV